MSLEPRFAYSSEPLHVLAPANVIPVNDLFLLGLLNSKLGKEFFADVSIQRGADYLEFKPVYVRQFPVPDANANERNAISALVKKCLAANGRDCGEWERSIDERVAALYGF